MRMAQMIARRPTNLSLPTDLVVEARLLGVNLSRACEEGLERSVSEARRAQWLADNRAALDSSNAYVEAHGLPLAARRLF